MIHPTSAARITPPPGLAEAATDPTPWGDRTSLAGLVAACWGVGAHAAVLLVAARKLLRSGLSGLAAAGGEPSDWLLAAACVAAFCYFQGYLGFQRGFSRMVAARARHLAAHPTPWHAALAPLHVCGLVHATARRRAATAALFAAIPCLSWGVGRLPEPLHGAVALGVAAGLTWGLVSMVALSARAAAGRLKGAAADLPGEVRP